MRKVSARGAIGLPLADQFLRFTLARAEETIQEELATIPDVCFSVFDRSSNIFAVLNINRQKHKLYVVTYGDASTMYPRYGDTVIQCNEYGRIRLVNWTFQRKEPVPTSIFCELNGKKLRLQWTKYSTKVTRSRKVRRESEQVLRSIATVLSRSVKTLPENQTVNILDWRSGTLVSVKVAADTNTLDIILFRTADFVFRDSQYTRIDITENSCMIRYKE